jgi:hypothetical protein
MPESDSTWQAGRRRSSSEPRPPPQAMFADDSLRRQLTGPHLQPLYEDGANPTTGSNPPPSRGPTNARRGITRQSSAFHMRRNQKAPNQNMMGHNVVDVLDVIGQYIPRYPVLYCELTRVQILRCLPLLH